MIYEKSLPDHSLVEWADFLKASRGQTLVGVVAKKEPFARFVALVLTQPNVFIRIANVCVFDYSNYQGYVLLGSWPV